MGNLIKGIFVGPMQDPYKYVRPAIQNQWKNITAIWRNEAAATFGIERLFRLFLAFSAYLFPGLYIRHLSGKRGLLSRKLALDAYVTVKVLVPIAILGIGLESNVFFQILVVYLGVETLLYVLSLLFISDIYKAPISHKRSYLMVLMNYVELCLDCAVLYKGLNAVGGMSTALDSVYFSFVTAFTVGFGDMTPKCDAGKLIVIAQSLSSLVLITLVFTRIISGFDKQGISSNK